MARRRRTVTVRIPVDVATDLRAHADGLGYPFPWLVARILREWMATAPTEIALTHHTEDEGDDNGG